MVLFSTFSSLRAFLGEAFTRSDPSKKAWTTDSDATDLSKLLTMLKAAKTSPSCANAGNRLFDAKHAMVVSAAISDVVLMRNKQAHNGSFQPSAVKKAISSSLSIVEKVLPGDQAWTTRRQNTKAVMKNCFCLIERLGILSTQNLESSPIELSVGALKASQTSPDDQSSRCALSRANLIDREAIVS